MLKQNFSHIHRHYPSHIDHEAHHHQVPQQEHPQHQIVMIEVPTERQHHHSQEHHEHHEHPHRVEENLQNRFEAEEFALIQENEELKKNVSLL